MGPSDGLIGSGLSDGLAEKGLSVGPSVNLPSFSSDTYIMTCLFILLFLAEMGMSKGPIVSGTSGGLVGKGSSGDP